MKTAVASVISFVAGIALTMAVCQTLKSAERAHFQGGVVFPTHAIIADINQTIQKGDSELAGRKLELLDKKFWEFRDGGASPEIFVSDIKALK